MNLKELGENFAFIDREQFKVKKFWLFRAWIFGKRAESTICENGFCFTTSALIYRGTVYIYKENLRREVE